MFSGSVIGVATKFLLGFGLGYLALSSVLLARLLRRPPPAPGLAAEPATWFRPLKAGDAGMRSRLEDHLQALPDGDQLLVGVGENDFVNRYWLENWKEERLTVVVCSDLGVPNPKINKLLQMTRAARHELWVVMDSEAVVDRAWCESLLREWSQSICELLTLPYRFTAPRTLGDELDQLTTAGTHWPGVAMATRGGPSAAFAFGACQVLTKSWLDRLGGWERFAPCLAEDHELGRLTAARGGRVEIARTMVTLQSEGLTLQDFWRRQRRVARTYRAADPGGFAGMILLQGMAFFSGGCLLGRWRMLGPLLLLGLAKSWVGWVNGRRLGLQLDKRAWPLKMWMTAMVEAACWILAWLPLPVGWAGRRYRVEKGNRMRRWAPPTER